MHSRKAAWAKGDSIPARIAILVVASLLACSSGAVSALAAGAVPAPLAPYPVAPPLPAGDSVIPHFLDDDETVRSSLRPDGSVAAMKDDILLKAQGSGDFVVKLVNSALSVTALGGDEQPSLDSGHVTWMGHIAGDKQLAAEASIDPAQFAPKLPLRSRLAYTRDGNVLDPSRPPPGPGVFHETISLENLTGADATFLSGAADPGPLATVLEALRVIADRYTPETDLAAVYPVPATLPLTSPATRVVRRTFVPMALDLTLRLDPAATEVVAPGAAITTDSRGTTVRWVTRLPAGTAGAGTQDTGVTYRAPRFRLPGLELRVLIAPLPAPEFTPAGGGTWSDAIKHSHDIGALAVLAQAGAASLHRIADVSPPLGRPGPGPERVQYRFILDSGEVARPHVAAPPSKPQGWAIGLALTLVAVVVANAWWAWSRN